MQSRSNAIVSLVPWVCNRRFWIPIIQYMYNCRSCTQLYRKFVTTDPGYTVVGIASRVRNHTMTIVESQIPTDAFTELRGDRRWEKKRERTRERPVVRKNKDTIVEFAQAWRSFDATVHRLYRADGRSASARYRRMTDTHTVTTSPPANPYAGPPHRTAQSENQL